MTFAASARRQIETVEISIHDLCGADSFADGYNAVQAGLSFDYDAWRLDEEQAELGEGAWGYERGRAVAIYARRAEGSIPPLYVDRGKGFELNLRVIVLVMVMTEEGLFI